MRVLTLSQWYAPEPDNRVHLLGRELVRRGHHVTAITSFPNYPQGRIYPGYRQRAWQWENMHGVQVLRLPLYPDHSNSLTRRGLNYLSFAASASLLGAPLCGPADVMWVYHPPLTIGIPAWWIALIRRVPFVFEVQDIWPDAVLASGQVSSHLMLRWMRTLAQFIYRKAASVTVISNGFKESLIAKGVPAEKIRVIPNWADEELYRPVRQDPELAAQYGLADRFNIVYAGNMGPAQALSDVLEAATLLGDLPEVRFTLIGDGVELPALQRQAQGLGLCNVRFLGRQPAERMPHFLALADALLVHLKRDTLFETTVPGKTIAYLACGRPIIAALAGDGANVVRDAGAGLICSPGNPAFLASAVRDLYSLPSEQREAMGRAGRTEFLRKYSQRVIMDSYEDVLAQVVRGRKHGKG